MSRTFTFNFVETDSIKYAKNLIEITDQDLAIIMEAIKTLLF